MWALGVQWHVQISPGSEAVVIDRDVEVIADMVEGARRRVNTCVAGAM
jgi:hypothetical protein